MEENGVLLDWDVASIALGRKSGDQVQFYDTFRGGTMDLATLRRAAKYSWSHGYNIGEVYANSRSTAATSRKIAVGMIDAILKDLRRGKDLDQRGKQPTGWEDVYAAYHEGLALGIASTGLTLADSLTFGQIDGINQLNGRLWEDSGLAGSGWQIGSQIASRIGVEVGLVALTLGTGAALSGAKGAAQAGSALQKGNRLVRGAKAFFNTSRSPMAAQARTLASGSRLGTTALKSANWGACGWDAVNTVVDTKPGIQMLSNGIPWGALLVFTGALSGVGAVAGGYGALRRARSSEALFGRRTTFRSLGQGAGLPGHPESSLPLPPSAGIAFSESLEFAGTDPVTGAMVFNPHAWARATDGQRAGMFWEEYSHSSRILSRGMKVRKVNKFLYERFALGRALEETKAMYDALGSRFQGRLGYAIRYGLTYDNMHPAIPTAQAIALIGGGVALGYPVGSSSGDGVSGRCGMIRRALEYVHGQLEPLTLDQSPQFVLVGAAAHTYPPETHLRYAAMQEGTLHVGCAAYTIRGFWRRRLERIRGEHHRLPLGPFEDLYSLLKVRCTLIGPPIELRQHGPMDSGRRWILRGAGSERDLFRLDYLPQADPAHELYLAFVRAVAECVGDL